MALPKAIQQQVEDADRMVQEMTGDGTDTPTELNPTPPTESEDPTPVVNDKSQEPKPAPVVSEDTWEQKYHSLKSKYDAEVPRLYAQGREMQEQIHSLIAEKAKLEAAHSVAPAEPVKSLITEQDKEAFGTDLIDLIERATESKISGFKAREGELLSEINELKAQLGDVSERQVVSDKDRFLFSLGQKVPDWEQLNVDSGFLQWLSEVDPVYGMPRQYALTNAYNALDVDRVAKIFNTFKASVAPKPTDKQPKPSLQSQVAPTRSRATSAPTATDANQKFWSQPEIEEFYSEWRRGYLDDEEAVRMEKEIHAAIAEGRVR
jgi:hypothetical protein